mmetsp:Transcript_31848/g.52501  ORF Transcript_31848/g.52501 Transcript_31848/m.52501 type:complete len:369 (-) Transcript_31848:45-1151(-)
MAKNRKIFLHILLIVVTIRLYFTYENSRLRTRSALFSNADESGPTKMKNQDSISYDGRRMRERIPLDILTDERGQNISCPPNTRPVFNSPGTSTSTSTNHFTYKIPLVIHQGCKSRCVSDAFYNLTETWKAFGIPYYFHDDAAVDRLVYSGLLLPEFPHLPLVWEHCIIKPVVKSDIWRMLLLYEYGGIYVDLDAKPGSFSPTRNILPDDEMYALAQPDYLPSFHFLASMPKHSLPFLTVHEQLRFLLFVTDTGVYNPARRTGPGAMKSAINLFSKDAGKQLENSGKVDNGNFTFQGINGHTMRREGMFTKSKTIVNPCAFLNDEKVKQYKTNNVTHYAGSFGHKSKTYTSCFEVITKHLNGDKQKER